LTEQKLTKELDAKKAELLSIQEGTAKVIKEGSTSRQLLSNVSDLKGMVGRVVTSRNVAKEPMTSTEEMKELVPRELAKVR
jgi:hypothetical protein